MVHIQGSETGQHKRKTLSLLQTNSNQTIYKTTQTHTKSYTHTHIHTWRPKYTNKLSFSENFLEADKQNTDKRFVLSQSVTMACTPPDLDKDKVWHINTATLWSTVSQSLECKLELVSCPNTCVSRFPFLW